MCIYEIGQYKSENIIPEKLNKKGFSEKVFFILEELST